MEKDNVELKPFENFLKRPEDLWRQGIAAQQSTGKNDLKKLLYALQMHQIELEMQNEEPRRSQAELVEPIRKEVQKRTAELVKTNEKLRRELKHRKQVEKALLESEQRFRLLAEFTYDWEYWIAPDGNYIYVSPSCERITGYHPDEFIRDTGLFEKLIHPDDRALLNGHFNKDLMSRDVKSLDFRIRSRNGKERWISHICQPIYDDNGQFAGRRASNRDITERKLAEQALHEVRKKLETRVEERTKELKTTAKKLKTKQKELARHKDKLELVNKDLLETNKAVSLLARNMEREKDEAEKMVVKIIRSKALPVLEEFQRNKAFEKYQPDIEELMMTFSKLTPGFKKSAQIITILSSSELRIASMIKNGLTSQEIANFLHISLDTVKAHRRGIRKKLKLNNSNINLRSYLEVNMG
jgi:PAS domain S-box-containing protein